MKSNLKRELSGDYSAPYTPIPSDARCKYWCKVIPAGANIPMPAAVSGAGDVPGEYLRKGDEIEVFAGDWVLEGEEISHRKARGWTYSLRRVVPVGTKLTDDSLTTEPTVVTVYFGSNTKDALRELGNQKELLRGAGDVAALIREIHYRRLLAQTPVTPELETAESSDAS